MSRMRWVCVATLLCCVSGVSAQTSTEDFEGYTAGQTIVGQGGWYEAGTNTGGTLQVISGDSGPSIPGGNQCLKYTATADLARRVHKAVTDHLPAPGGIVTFEYDVKWLNATAGGPLSFRPGICPEDAAYVGIRLGQFSNPDGLDALYTGSTTPDGANLSWSGTPIEPVLVDRPTFGAGWVTYKWVGYFGNGLADTVGRLLYVDITPEGGSTVRIPWLNAYAGGWPAGETLADLDTLQCRFDAQGGGNQAEFLVDNFRITTTVGAGTLGLPSARPTANAGPDTLFACGDPVTLVGGGTDDTALDFYVWLYEDSVAASSREPNNAVVVDMPCLETRTYELLTIDEDGLPSAATDPVEIEVGNYGKVNLAFNVKTLPVTGNNFRNSMASDGTNVYFLNNATKEFYSSTDGSSWTSLPSPPGAMKDLSNTLVYTSTPASALVTYTDDKLTIFDGANWTQFGQERFGNGGFTALNGYVYGNAHASMGNQGGNITRADLNNLAAVTCERGWMDPVATFGSTDNSNWFSRVVQFAAVGNMVYGIKNDWVTNPRGTGDRLYVFDPIDMDAAINTFFGPDWDDWTEESFIGTDLGELPFEPGYGSCLVGLPPNWKGLVGPDGGLFLLPGRTDANNEGWGGVVDDFAIYNITTGAWQLGKLCGYSSSGTAATFHDGEVWIKQGSSSPVNPDGSPTDAIWVTATPINPPVADAGPDDTVNVGLCDPATYVLDASGTLGATRYRWVDEFGTILSDSNSPTVEVTLPLGGGLYTVYAWNDACEFDWDDVFVDISYPALDPPIADAGPASQSVTTGPDGVVQVDASGSFSDCGLMYTWTDITDPNTPVELIETTQPVVNVQLTEGVHTVELLVTDVRGQTATDVTVITVTYEPIAIDNVDTEFSIEQGDIHGTAVSSYAVPNRNVSIGLVSQRIGIPDPTADRQLLFDSVGNVYYETWYHTLKSLKPDLSDRWETPSTGNGKMDAGAFLIGERYAYYVGPGAVNWDHDGDPGTAALNYNPTLHAVNKVTGDIEWSTELAPNPYWDDSSHALNRHTLTLLNNKLYVFNGPALNADVLDPLVVFQVDSTSGNLDWADEITVGAKQAYMGNCVIVEDLYGAGVHGLFAQGSSEGEADGLTDMIAIEIDSDASTGGATNAWGTGIDAGWGEYSRMIYDPITGGLYSCSQWNWAGKQYWKFNPMTGGWIDPNDPNYDGSNPNAYLAYGVRGGDFAIGGQSAALGIDGGVIYSPGDAGYLYRYIDTSAPSPTNIDDLSTDVAAYWYGNDLWQFGERSISLADCDGNQMMLLHTSDWRWWPVDPNDPANDERYADEVWLLDLSGEPQGANDAELDDGPVLIDNITVKVNSGTVLTEDFEGFIATDPNDPNTLFINQVDPNEWTWAGTPGTEDSAVIIDTFGPRGKVLRLDPFGGSNNVAAVVRNLPDAYGPQFQDIINIEWYQYREDYTDNLFVGESTFPAAASFQGDGSESAYPKGYVTGFVTDPVGGSGTFAPLLDPNDPSFPDWQEIHLEVDYFIPRPVTVETGPIGGPFTTDGPGAVIDADALTTDYDELKFEFRATRATSSGYVEQPETPIASYQTNLVDPVTWSKDWDHPVALSISPNGEVYYMQFKGYDRRYTRLRITGDCVFSEACCFPDDSCEALPADECVAQGGTAQGPGSVCDPNPCGTSLCPGDANCDGFINFRDIDYFVAAQNDNVAAWEALFGGTPPCDFLNNDVNGDGFVNFRDIDPFVGVQNTTCP